MTGLKFTMHPNDAFSNLTTLGYDEIIVDDRSLSHTDIVEHAHGEEESYFDPPTRLSSTTTCVYTLHCRVIIDGLQFYAAVPEATLLAEYDLGIYVLTGGDE
jgi:hypothetical protein|tara:strand:- start:507 stop:812 length:306 start_codon:yes stop_codon:yes gene_type:complete